MAGVGGTVYVIGGFDGTSPQTAIYATRDGTRFRRVGSLPTGLRYAAAAAVGGRVAIAGGVSATGPVATVEVFDPATGRTGLLGPLPGPVGHAAAIAFGEVVYVIGGLDAAGNAVRSVTRIDVRTGKISSRRALAHPLSDAGVA